MLANAGGQDRFTLGQLVKDLDRHLGQDHFALFAFEMVAHVLRLDHFIGHAIPKRRAGFPFGDLLVPGSESLFDWPFFDHGRHATQGIFNIADDGQIGRLVLVDLGRVDIDMHDRAAFAELFNFARHAVIETDAKGEQ